MCAFASGTLKKRLAQDMGDELRKQEGKISELEDKTDRTQDNLANLSTNAKKDFKLRGKCAATRPPHRRSLGGSRYMMNIMTLCGNILTSALCADLPTCRQLVCCG